MKEQRDGLTFQNVGSAETLLQVNLGCVVIRCRENISSRQDLRPHLLLLHQQLQSVHQKNISYIHTHSNMYTLSVKRH